MLVRRAEVETYRVPANSIVMENATYPQPVLEYLNEGIEELRELFLEEDVEVHGPEAFLSLMGPIMLEQWLERGEMRYSRITEEGFYQIVGDVIVEARFRKLKSMGLIDGVEDENGEMVWFLTEDGKNVGQRLKKVEKQIEIKE